MPFPPGGLVTLNCMRGALAHRKLDGENQSVGVSGRSVWAALHFGFVSFIGIYVQIS